MTAEEIAAGLSEAQKRAVISGGVGKAWSTTTALHKRGIVSIRTCFPDGQGIVLTPLGQQVRAILESNHDRA